MEREEKDNNFESFLCTTCGNDVELLPMVQPSDMNSGWYRLFDDVSVLIPEGTLIPTCYNCGEHYSSYQEDKFNNGKSLEEIVFSSFKETLKAKKLKETSLKDFQKFSCFCTKELELGTVDLVLSRGLVRSGPDNDWKKQDNDWMEIFSNIKMVIPKGILIPKCNLLCEFKYYFLPCIRNNIYNACLQRLQNLVEDKNKITTFN